MCYDSEAASVEVTASPAQGWASLMHPFAKPAGGMIKGVDGHIWRVASVASGAQGKSDHLPELHSHHLDGDNSPAPSRLLNKCS